MLDYQAFIKHRNEPIFKDKLDEDQSLLDIDISEKVVQQKLSKLKEDKSPGPFSSPLYFKTRPTA